LTIKTIEEVRRFNCKDQSKLKFPESSQAPKEIIDSPYIFVDINETTEKEVDKIIKKQDKKFNLLDVKNFCKKIQRIKLSNGRKTETKNNS
jgi:molybdenum cofactor biosynthesis enzyme MoaA